MPRITESEKIALARKQDIAKQYLAMTRRDIEFAQAALAEAMTARQTHVLNARTYGMSNQAIGDELGITETAVRKIIQNAGA